MANIQQEISSFLPEATFVEGTILEVSVPDAKWHDLALYLHNQLHFDYLVSIVGMDWGETVGCVYYLTSTVDNSQVSVKIETADRENPLLHSVSDIWKSANLYEREVYDFLESVLSTTPICVGCFCVMTGLGILSEKIIMQTLN